MTLKWKMTSKLVKKKLKKTLKLETLRNKNNKRNRRKKRRRIRKIRRSRKVEGTWLQLGIGHHGSAYQRGISSRVGRKVILHLRRGRSYTQLA